jgi:tRNA dimethylallyltransferase
MTTFEQLALIGPTASGKTALAIELAHKINANILSLDSLAIYKEIDIASAKPTPQERGEIPHFGIDLIFPNNAFDVTTFVKLYEEVKTKSIQDNKNLIIVGGTSFYLNILLNGISTLPKISNDTQQKTVQMLNNLENAYKFLSERDPHYMKSIEFNDRYRIEKMLNLYFETQLIPSDYFKRYPPQATIRSPLPIYEIDVDREVLRQRIRKRTAQMMKMGLIDEVFYLEKNYTRLPNCMKSIGIKEVLSYLDGDFSKKEMQEKIITHTAQLAKRQRTFNKSQFQTKIQLPLQELTNLLLKK